MRVQSHGGGGGSRDERVSESESSIRFERVDDM